MIVTLEDDDDDYLTLDTLKKDHHLALTPPQ
jgi:hypothetical protein